MKPSHPRVTLEKNQHLPGFNRRSPLFASRPFRQSLFLFSVCTATLSGAIFYVMDVKKEVCGSKNCVQQGSLEPVASKQEDPAIDHIFWESVTRLIISAKK